MNLYQHPTLNVVATVIYAVAATYATYWFIIAPLITKFNTAAATIAPLL